MSAPGSEPGPDDAPVVDDERRGRGTRKARFERGETVEDAMRMTVDPLPMSRPTTPFTPTSPYDPRWGGFE